MKKNESMQLLKIYARSFYDFQEVKNEFAGRLRASELVDKMPKDRLTELNTYQQQLEIAEKKLLKIIEPYLEEIPIYTEFLSQIKGCAVRMSACLITSIVDIKRFATISKLWAYAGLHVKDGRAVRRKRGEKSNWNSFLKTKLHVLADCLMKLNFDDEKKPLRYRKFYDDYKHRMENRAACHLTREEHSKKAAKIELKPKEENARQNTIENQKENAPTVTWLPNGCTKGHVHAMALRYIEKMLLQDLWLKWYELEDVDPPTRPYAEAILGRTHGEYPKPIAANA